MVNIIKYVTIPVNEENEDEEKEKTLELCPECSSQKLITDFHRLEIYCADCGLVVKSWDLLTFQDIENIIKFEEKKKKNKKKREFYSSKKNLTYEKDLNE